MARQMQETASRMIPMVKKVIMVFSVIFSYLFSSLRSLPIFTPIEANSYKETVFTFRRFPFSGKSRSRPFILAYWVAVFSYRYA